MRQAHLGAKSKAMMRTYNLTCNHRRKILHTTEGHHPARWNDKTLIRFDSFMSELCDGALNDKMDFKLRTRQGMTSDDDGEDRTLKLRGAYAIVDNGNIEWSTTVLPLKALCNRSELRFSQWLGSRMQKDVECTFGILKGRWRILKSGIRLYNTEIADNIWLTCSLVLYTTCYLMLTASASPGTMAFAHVGKRKVASLELMTSRLQFKDWWTPQVQKISVCANMMGLALGININAYQL